MSDRTHTPTKRPRAWQTASVSEMLFGSLMIGFVFYLALKLVWIILTF